MTSLFLRSRRAFVTLVAGLTILGTPAYAKSKVVIEIFQPYSAPALGEKAKRLSAELARQFRSVGGYEVRIDSLHGETPLSEIASASHASEYITGELTKALNGFDLKLAGHAVATDAIVAETDVELRTDLVFPPEFSVFSLSDKSDSLYVAWIACFACFFVSSRVAGVFLRNTPRLFTVMALFALSWALLLVFWNANVTSGASRAALRDIPAFGDFLWVYIGALLMLEALDPEKQPAIRIVPWQRFALWALGLVVVPSIPLLDKLISSDHLATALEIILDFGSSVVMFVGIRQLYGKKASLISGSILLIYAGLEFASEMLDFVKGNSRLTEPWEIFGFAIIKCVFTIVFCCTVTYHAMTAEERKVGPAGWSLRFVGLA